MLGQNLKQSSVFLLLHNPVDALELKKILTEHYSNQSIKKLCESINTLLNQEWHIFFVILEMMPVKNFGQLMGQNGKLKLNFSS